jgi:hypothetical protein
MRTTSLFFASSAVLVAAALAGCGNPLSLNPASFENRLDTLKLWAATNTPVTQPSGYVLVQRQVVRLDQVSGFDFVYDIDRQGRHILLPLAAIVSTGSTAGNPGFLTTDTPFDQVTLAEQVGYISKDTVLAAIGRVYYVRSTVDGSCSLGIPYYAKMQILSFDDGLRTMRFRIVANVNCGYRGLELGIPTR